MVIVNERRTKTCHNYALNGGNNWKIAIAMQLMVIINENETEAGHNHAITGCQKGNLATAVPNYAFRGIGSFLTVQKCLCSLLHTSH